MKTIEEKHCRIYKLEIPAKVKANRYEKVEFICHIDKGTVEPCWLFENCKENPGAVIVKVAGQEYKVPPGDLLAGCLSKGYSKCTLYSPPYPLEIKFTKRGYYILRFMAGYREEIGIKWTDSKIAKVQVEEPLLKCTDYAFYLNGVRYPVNSKIKAKVGDEIRITYRIEFVRDPNPDEIDENGYVHVAVQIWDWKNGEELKWLNYKTQKGLPLEDVVWLTVDKSRNIGIAIYHKNLKTGKWIQDQWVGC